MKAVIVVLALLVVGSFALRSSFHTPHFNKDGRDHKQVFSQWMRHFEMEFPTIAEEAKRFVTFVKNWEHIHHHNHHGNFNFTLGINQFAGMNGEEFRRHIHGHDQSCMLLHRPRKVEYSPEKAFVKVPTSVDWTTKGVVTPVKNQGQCGSCWAFSTTGSIESRTAISTGKLVSLSEQQLVDCSGSFGNMGCNGGLMDSAFKYVKSVGGLCTEEAYPYKARNGQCKASSCGKMMDPITGYTDVTHDSSMSLEAAVAAGPVSIAIEADQSSFQFYKSGVMSGTCGARLDHGVLVVGYGTAQGSKFWKVKNSWGATWGESGYIRMCRDCGKDNGAGECGILSEPSYPSV
jgi:cathepsin L